MVEEGSGSVLLTLVVPALGAIISLLMYASPLAAILNAQRVKYLGDLNPLPFSITVANTIIWSTYGQEELGARPPEAYMGSQCKP